MIQKRPDPKLDLTLNREKNLCYPCYQCDIKKKLRVSTQRRSRENLCYPCYQCALRESRTAASFVSFEFSDVKE